MNWLTFFRIFVASFLSSIVLRPVPSTSHTPACAMFHNPSFSLPKKPSAKKRGSATKDRTSAGWCVTNCAATRATVTPTNTLPTSPRLVRSSKSMFVSASAAAARNDADCSSENFAPPSFSSTSSVNTPHLIRFPGVAYMALNCVASGSVKSSNTDGVSAVSSLALSFAKGTTTRARRLVYDIAEAWKRIHVDSRDDARETRCRREGGPDAHVSRNGTARATTSAIAANAGDSCTQEHRGVTAKEALATSRRQRQK